MQNELVVAVNELRDNFCNLYFEMDYADLNTANPNEEMIHNGIRKIYKMNISESEPKNINR